MTRQVTVSMGRRLSLEDLNDSSSQSEFVSVDSPQNGDVDVVTVDNAAEVDSLIGSQKSPLGFSGLYLKQKPILRLKNSINFSAV